MSKFIFAGFGKKLDFAYGENDIFLLDELKVVNSTGADWTDVKITMKSTPEFIKPQTWILEKISSESKKVLNDCVITTDTKFLKSLTKDTEAEIRFTLESDFIVLDECVQKVKLPAYNSERDNSLTTKNPTRIDIWQKKLLNLSPSNPLLNCKINKTNISVLCTNPAKLEDYIADGQKITLVSAEKIFGEKVSPELRSLTGCKKTIFEKAEKALISKQMPVNVPEDKLQSQTIALYRKTKSVLEEGGANTLYLAIGFLTVTPEKKNGKKYHAPLILCPVKLERITAQSGVKMSVGEDESRFNSTLLELLKQDFEISIPSLEGELPCDESGLDVFEIMNRVKDAVKDMPGFEVTDEVVLGHFSFNKYLMWRDFVAGKSSMESHPVVSAILNNDKKAEDNIEIVKPQDLDRQYSPDYFYTPLPADSSQLAIIATADKGKSFVIEGPPGTGKSQTISNLISHLLSKGKKVLFVSEKAAALNVVYKRLESIGLGNYCLELHSNKADKKDVLNKLAKSWESADTDYRDFRTTKAEEEAGYLKQLNRFVNALHTPLDNGITPYCAIEQDIRSKTESGDLILSFENANIHSSKDFENLKNFVHKVKIQAEYSPEIFESKIFSCITVKNWTPEWQTQVIDALENVVKSIEKNISAVKVVQDCIGFDIDVENIRNLGLINRLIKILRNLLSSSLFYIFDEDSSKIESALKKGLKYLKTFETEKYKIKFEYAPNIWNEVDLKSIFRRWERSKKAFFIKSYFEKKAIKKILKESGINGEIRLPEDIYILKNLHEISSDINKLNEDLIKVPLWDGDTTEVEKLKTFFKLKNEFLEIIDELKKNTDNPGNLDNVLKVLLSPKDSVLQKESNLRNKLSACAASHKKTEEFQTKFVKLCDPAMKGNNIFNMNGDDGETVHGLSGYLNILKTNPDLIKQHCQWNRLKEEASELMLMPMIKAVEKHFIKFENIEKVFISSYFAWLSRAAVSENPSLRDFSSIQYEDIISSYKTCDNEVKNLSIRYIFAKLSEGIPGKNSSDLTKEWKFLQREMKKQRKIKPVREIIDYAREAVLKLTPCFMMSPLSVAQYLPVSTEIFDTVIMDEASQITVWDAAGALLRGKQVIVAGDSRQMPPSNFFCRTIEYDEDEVGLEEDLESILDELTAAGLPSLRLNWHYRSKCESLIAFSNKKYYDGTLVTFPSPMTSQHSVKYRPVPDGIYEKGARVNIKEAMMLVNECMSRLTSKNPEIRNKSIGIVTFNSAQQKLIEDMLDKERELHPEIEFAFSPDNLSPLFVKNLETVQGDERDVILFSVTYAPDKNGKICMNFGPLNRIGGERRLNVAFTRSKYETVIFSSLQPEQIDLSKTSAKGVSDLKEFLLYAKTGNIESTNDIITGSSDNLFEAEIAQRLSEKGWTVHTKIGKSALKVDLAVADPENPGEYIAGIITDGDIYKNAATACDRVKTFPLALEMSGWKLIKIHITDWWNDPDGTLGRLNNTLYKLYEKNKSSKDA